MKRARLALAMLALGTSAVQAASMKTWISGNGDDANPCSRDSPCKTFAAAISKTSAGGEVGTLNSGNFGAVTITKSMRLDGSASGVAAISISGTNGITISAGANDVVILRNLMIKGINGAGTTRGIRFISGKALIIENCDIYGFGQRAISIEPTINAQVFIHNTNIHAGQSNGIMVQPVGSAKVSMALDNLRINDNVNYGMLVYGGSTVTMRDSIISNHGLAGIRADASTGAVQVNLEHVTINDAQTGIQVVGPANVAVSSSDIVSNGLGISGTVYSFGTNRLSGNTSGNGTPMSPVSLN